MEVEKQARKEEENKVVVEEEKKETKEVQKSLEKSAIIREELGKIISGDIIDSNENTEMRFDNRPGQ